MVILRAFTWSIREVLGSRVFAALATVVAHWIRWAWNGSGSSVALAVASLLLVSTGLVLLYTLARSCALSYFVELQSRRPEL